MSRTAFVMHRLASLALVALAGCDGGPGGSDARLDAGPVVAPGETGRMVGMTQAHNSYRAMVSATPPLPALQWDAELARIAQAHADSLAADDCNFEHSDTMLGENMTWSLGTALTPAAVVGGWYGEVACYTFGPFMRGDACDMACTRAMNASGCGHYTQVVWRATQRVGCGLAMCSSGAEIWVCNYDPAGNFLGQPAF